MIKNLIVIFLFFNLFNIIAQNIDSKYLISIIYLKSNSKIQKEIKGFFKKDIQRNKKCNISFQISNKITFIDIETFREELKANDIIPYSDSLISKEKGIFKEYYQFDKLYNNILENFLESNNLSLNFSKPTSNFLVAELTNFDMNVLQGIKFGKGFRLLFVFGKDGFIKKVFTKTFIYN